MQVKPLLLVQIQSLQKQVPDLYGPLKEDELVHSGKHGPVTTCLGQSCDMFLLSDSKMTTFYFKFVHFLNLHICYVFLFSVVNKM